MTITLLIVAALLILMGVMFAFWAFSGIYSHQEPLETTSPTDPISPDVPAVNPETDPEKIFIKTIHDFDGYRVENLDDQEDTNFVVYAKGVQELTATATSNVLQGVDENTLTYTFSYPDDAMKALQPGDVFFVGVTEQTPNGDTVKVKSIKLSGNSAVIQGDEVKMEDIYIYMDVDMSLDSIPVEAEQSSIARRTGSMEANQVKLEDRIFRIPLLFSTGAASNGPSTSISGSGLIKGGLKNTRLTMRYSLMHCYFSVQLDSHLFVDATMKLECKGSIKYSPEAPLIAPIPLPFLPGQFLIVNMAALTEGYVQLDGKMEFHSAYDIGMSYNVYDGIKSHFDHAGTTKDLDLSVEGGLSHSVGLKIGVGIPKVWDAYVQGDFGVSLEGEMTFPGEEDYPKDAESIHDCDKCIDGVCHIFVQGSAGVELKVAEELWGISVGASLSTPRKSLDKVDFYYSFRGEKKEFGLDDCPHMRWRTEVTVEKQDGTKVSGAIVEATFEDGRTDEGTTDSNGKAVLYLPNGSNQVACEHENGKGEVEISINEKPVNETVVLRSNKVLYIMDCLWTPDDPMIQERCPELYTVLSNRYPDAIWLVPSEAARMEGNDGHCLDILIDQGYTQAFEFLFWDVSVSGFVHCDTEEIDSGGYIVEHAYCAVSGSGKGMEGINYEEFDIPIAGMLMDASWSQMYQIVDNCAAEYIMLLFPVIDEWYLSDS